jgi:hypothetical protein
MYLYADTLSLSTLSSACCAVFAMVCGAIVPNILLNVHPCTFLHTHTHTNAYTIHTHTHTHTQYTHTHTHVHSFLVPVLELYTHTHQTTRFVFFGLNHVTVTGEFTWKGFFFRKKKFFSCKFFPLSCICFLCVLVIECVMCVCARNVWKCVSCPPKNWIFFLCDKTGVPADDRCKHAEYWCSSSSSRSCGRLSLIRYVHALD